MIREQTDVVVIGGGVNGCGVARDLALRGIKVLLLERHDISMGTSWASSGMIHGGIRYLLSDVHTTVKSCKDAGYIRSIAPHLIFRIPILFPILKDDGLNGWINLEGADGLFSHYDRYQPYKGGKRHLRLSPDETRRVEPLLAGDLLGAVSTDEWGIDVPRLCVANALDALEHGATIRTWTEVTALAKDGARVVGVEFRDLLTGEHGLVRAAVVINCGGPWAPGIAGKAGTTVKLRPAKGVHLVLDRRITNNAVVVQAVDGRQVFLMPHENTSMIGTTDDDYYGDPDAIPVTEDEIKYLLEAFDRFVPRLREARIIKTIAGIRPTLYEINKVEDDLTRDHRVVDHAKDGVEGFVSLIGGKLAAYRVMAEETADAACRKLGRHVACTSHLTPLPGGDRVPDPNTLAKTRNLDPYAVSRLIFRQGSRAERVLSLIDERPALRDPICGCDPVMEAELRHAIRHEFVRRASDLIGRCRIAEGPCQGLQCAMRAATIFGEEKGLAPDQVVDEAVHLLREKWRWRRPVLSGAQMAGEELYRLVHRALLDPALAARQEEVLG